MGRRRTKQKEAGGNCTVNSLGDHVREGEIGGWLRMQGRDRRQTGSSGGKALTEDTARKSCLDDRTILK
jgi:hypothetical protein